jgi:hypothetical protein
MNIFIFSCFLVVIASHWSDKVEGQVVPVLTTTDQTSSPEIQDTTKTPNVQSADVDGGSSEETSASQSSANSGDSGDSQDAVNVQSADVDGGSGEDLNGDQTSDNYGASGDSLDTNEIEVDPTLSSADQSDVASEDTP